MIAEQIKKAVLQAAIQGRLTEQLPEDGDARDLLKDIQKEKVRLVKEGKLKKEKPLPEITEDEIPFEIPENWVWARLGDLTELNPRNKIDDDTPVSFIPMTLIDDGYTNTFNSDKRCWKEIKSGFTHFADNDVIVAKITPCFQNRKSAVVRDLINGYGAGTTELHVVRPLSSGIISDYILYLVKTEYFIGDGVLSMTGTAGQQRVGKTYFENLLFPLPPTKEQQRIVEKLEEVLPEIERLAVDETKLNDLEKAFPKKMKDAILQYAIQGKLTEQLPEDGDAHDLLKDIQKEKARLIQEGKLKKEKILPEITEDEIPFDIPENWIWVRLGDVNVIIMGQSPDGSSVGKNIGIEFHQGKISFTDKYINDSELRCSKPKKIAPEDSILLCVRAPVGIVNITTRDICIGRGLTALNPIGGIDRDFLYYFLKTCKGYFDERATGSTFKAINQKTIEMVPFPLQPISEQKRIVEKLDQVLPLLDRLE